MNYQPATAGLIQQIEHGWRGDMSAAGREHKEAGVGGRASWRKAIEQASGDEKGAKP